MNKSILLQAVTQQWSSMGIPYITGAGSDLGVVTEFLDAGFSTGSKRITYEASVFLDESSRTAFMWEKTTEVGQGLSFGGDSGSSFQSGTTLFRKVKSVQYAPDGKAYEYTLDLGAIPKAVKEAAKANGWDFKTVLKHEKALYPAGYSPAGQSPPYAGQPGYTAPFSPQASSQQNVGFCNNCGMPLTSGSRFCGKCGLPVGTAVSAAAPPVPQNAAPNPPQQQYANPQGSFYAQAAPQKKSSKAVLNNIGIAILVLITAGIALLAGISILGMVLTFIVFILLVLLTNKFVKKGCLPVILMWILALVAIILIFAFTLVPSSNGSSPNGSANTGVPVSGSAQTGTGNQGSSAPFEIGISNTRGNTNGNIINHGYAVLQDNNIFIAARSNLYVMKKDGSGLTALTVSNSFMAHDLNLLGEWLYYVNENSYITRMSILTGDIESMETLSNVDNLIVTSDSIYCISNANAYRIDLATSEYTQLTDTYCQSLNLTEDYLYYQDNMSYTTAIKLKVDGTERTVFTPDLLSYSMFLVSDGNFVYYSDNNSRNIYRENNDGSGKTLICDDQTLLLNVSGEYIYYANELDGNKVYRVKTDGSEKLKLCDVSAGMISVVGDFIVITTEESSVEATYIVRTDGSGLTKIE